MGEIGSQAIPHVVEPGLLLVRGGQVGAQDGGTRERARIDEQVAIAIVNARARARRRDQTPKQRPNPFGIDGEFERGSRFFSDVVALPRRELQQPLRIDRDRIRIDRGGRGDRRRDDLALRRQTLHAGIDQSGAELIEIEKADKQGDEAAEVQKDDAPRQRGGDAVLDGAPEPTPLHAHRPQRAGRGPARNLDVGCFLDLHAHLSGARFGLKLP